MSYSCHIMDSQASELAMVVESREMQGGTCHHRPRLLLTGTAGSKPRVSSLLRTQLHLPIIAATMPETRLQPSETRSSIAPDENKSERFRILIIGNDKTVNSAIFQKVCNGGGLKDRMGNLVCSIRTILDRESYLIFVSQISANLLMVYDIYLLLDHPR